VELVTVVWLVVVRQHFVTPVVAVGPEVQALDSMRELESRQIFLEIRLFMVLEVQDVEIQVSVLPKQPALELAHDLMRRCTLAAVAQMLAVIWDPVVQES
jgi:hypothetical protein